MNLGQQYLKLALKILDKAVKAAQKAFEGEWPKLLPKRQSKIFKGNWRSIKRPMLKCLEEIETIDTGKLV